MSEPEFEAALEVALIAALAKAGFRLEFAEAPGLFQGERGCVSREEAAGNG